MRHFRGSRLFAVGAAMLTLFLLCFPARAQGKRELVELGGLKSRPPADWVEEKPDQAERYKLYRLEAIDDDMARTRLTIDVPTKKNRLSAAKQIEQWKATFLPPEGRSLADVAKVQELKVGGAKLTYLDVHGDYKGIPGDETSPLPNHRLLAVYFDTAKGPYLIRLFGPADSVEYYRKGFEDWLKAFK